MRAGVATVVMAVVLIGVAGLAWLVLRDEAAPGAVRSSRTNESRSNETAIVADAASTKAEPSHALAAERTDDLAAEWNDGLHDVIGPVVEGTIVVTDRENVKHTNEDGSFVPDFVDGVDEDLSDPERERRRVAVKRGRFRFDARGATAMLAKEVELGSRIAVVEHGIELTADQPLRIDAHWIDDVLLHVVDAQTGTELTEVTLVRDATPHRPGFPENLDSTAATLNVDDFSPIPADPAPPSEVTNRSAALTAGVKGTEHPGRIRRVDVICEHERSPFHLSRLTPIGKTGLRGPMWVGAPGHVWKWLRRDFTRDGASTVMLELAGSVSVVVKEPPGVPSARSNDLRRLTDRWPRLRLRRPDRGESTSIVADLLAEPGETRLDGIEPGDLIASIEVGELELKRLVLGDAKMTIDAGKTARATIVADLGGAPKRTVLSGTMYVPPDWGHTRFEIEAVAVDLRGGTSRDLRITGAIDRVPNREDRDEWRSWTVWPILPGIYDLAVQRAGFLARVEVGPDGRDDVVLRLPEPVLLKVRPVDAETGAAVEVGPLTWRPLDPRMQRPRRTTISIETSESRDAYETMLIFDPTAHVYRGAVAAGRGSIAGPELFISVPGRDDSEPSFDVGPGEREIVLRVPAPCGVDLSIATREPQRDGSPFERVWFDVRWEQRDAVGEPRRGSAILHRLDRSSRIRLPAPGRYLIKLLRGSDASTEPAFEVDVPAGQFITHAIELERK